MKDPKDYLNGTGKLEPRPDDVVYSVSLGYSAPGEAYEIAGLKFPARPQDYEFSKKWMPFAGELIDQQKVKPHRIELREGGFEGILSGLDDLKSGKVSGKKLVYRVADP